MIKRMMYVFAALMLWTVLPWALAQEEENDEEVFELSPFEVDSSDDVGYRAANTLSGTRFNSSLNDTAASISVFTQEFLDDTGLTEIDELIEYSLSTVLDVSDQDGDGGGANTTLNATTTTQRIRTRGIESSRGVDYFKSIIPDDSYRIGRYDDSRGPNGVLFGVSYAGGLINQSSLIANTQRDSGRVQLSFGSDERQRANFRYNKVLVEGKLGLTLAGVHQENGGWRQYEYQDKDRIFGAATWKLNDRITIRGNYEEGYEARSNEAPFTLSDQSLPYYDNLMARGFVTVEEAEAANDPSVLATVFAPANRNPNADQRTVGVTGRDGNFNANNNRFTFIENDGRLFNAVGTLLTDGYDNADVRSPNGEPGQGGRYHRINDPDFLPYFVTGSGSSVYRHHNLMNYTFTTDIKLTENWFVNINHGFQDVELTAYQTTGSQPDLRADPNLTLGSVRGAGNWDRNPPENPYVGLFYIDGDFRRDTNVGDYRETRISTSYNLTTERFGNHQIAIAASRADENARRQNTNLALGGNPRGASAHNNANNRISVRNYITDVSDLSQFRVGDWRMVPGTVTTDRFTGTPTAYPVVWAQNSPGNINYLVDQSTESQIAVTQSRFWNGKLVATFGYREDQAEIDRFGHIIDPLIGHVPDPTNLDSTTVFDGATRTAGLVYHLNENFSLLANRGTSVGIPDFRRTVFPDGTTSPPGKGEGTDFGFNFNLLDKRISGRVVYYTTDSVQEVVGGGQAAGQKSQVYQAFESALVGDGLPYTVEQWAALEPELDPSVNGRFRDSVSEGYELRLTANPTKNWRLVLNASKTDRIVTKSFSKAIEWYGLKEGPDGLVVQGASLVEVPDPNDANATITQYQLDPNAYTSDGVIARWLEFESQLPGGQTINTLATPDEETVAFQIFDVVDSINDRREIDEKRWGLRPYRFNFYTSYDFDEGPLKGFSIGGGYRWQSANIIGEEDGVEYEGRAKENTDLMLRYRTKLKNKNRLTFQINVLNVLDQDGIVPSRLAGNGDLDYRIPGGRGIAYTRYDLIDPRSYRFTTTIDF